MANTKVHFSSASNHWATPQALFDGLDEYFHFTLDPCSEHDTAKVWDRHFTPAEDGLKQDWGKEVVFMNPPYAREIPKWIKKAYEASLKGATVVCLIPSRTDTAWWHDYCSKGNVLFLRGRVRFELEGKPLPAAAPFPSCLVLFSSPDVWAVNAARLRYFGEEYNFRVDKKRKSRKVVA